MEKLAAKLTIEDAIKNIDIVVSSVKMTRSEHIALVESIRIVKERCLGDQGSITLTGKKEEKEEDKKGG